MQSARNALRSGRLRSVKIARAITERIEEAEELFGAATALKQLWAVQDVSHPDLDAFAGREYEERVLGFLGAHL